MSVKTEEVLKGVTGITANSKEVKKGFLFVAIPGLTVDGHDYISEAIENGAKTIVGERDFKTPSSIPYIKVPDAREELARLAATFYNNPSQKLRVIGVTGTKGKTTTVHLIHHILNTLGRKAGIISSISVPGLHVTTPDVITLNKMLKEMVDSGCEYAVLEVGSHGIHQKRIAGIEFEVGVLTNIAPEHLDYHKTFSEYKKVKMSFIDSAAKKVISPKHSSLKILPGEFNNINVETAIKVVEKVGIGKTKALEAVKSFKLPAGRLEEVENDLGIKIFIDFAHTPDSLEASLIYLKSITKNKLISVFGCAGERDTKKRSKMGEISSKIADLSIFTAEDPRSENVFDILKTMESKAENYISISERGEAIAYALSKAQKGDTIALLGKGHEKSMSYKGFEHPWNDREIIEALLSNNEKISVVVLAAGMGTRMKYDHPKILMEICGRPMLSYTLENLRRLGIKDVILVVGFKKEEVIRQFEGIVKFAPQKTPKGGTADAANSGLQKVSFDSEIVVVINGDDSAFYKSSTIRDVIDSHISSNSILSFVTLEKDNPKGLGRIIRDSSGNLVGIIEEKDATEDQRNIKEVNDGLYVFNRKWLGANINKVQKSPVTGEYYIGDLIKMGLSDKLKVSTYKLKDSKEWQGINTPEELQEANQKMLERLKIE